MLSFFFGFISNQLLKLNNGLHFVRVLKTLLLLCCMKQQPYNQQFLNLQRAGDSATRFPDCRDNKIHQALLQTVYQLFQNLFCCTCLSSAKSVKTHTKSKKGMVERRIKKQYSRYNIDVLTELLQITWAIDLYLM